MQDRHDVNMVSRFTTRCPMLLLPTTHAPIVPLRETHLQFHEEQPHSNTSCMQSSAASLLTTSSNSIFMSQR